MSQRPPTFDQFVPTEGSREALELAVSLAFEWAGAPRLLLLHGPPGVGKTHLLRSIVFMNGGNPVSPAVYVSATRLVEALIAALHGVPGRDPCSVEEGALLAIDDLHILAGKPVTQTEVCRHLKALVESGRRVACAAGCEPSALPVLLSAVRALPAARVVELRRPSDREMRRILARLAAAERVRLPHKALLSAASRCTGDVRRAMGEINRVRLARSAGLPSRP